MPNRLNLARRPFVNTRPANAAVAVLILLVLVLSAVSGTTVKRYLEGSRLTRERILKLREELTALENQKRQTAASLARFDLFELSKGIGEVNAIARRRAFSWTRFLSRLERVLPDDLRVASIGLGKAAASGPEEVGAEAAQPLDSMDVTLGLVSRDPKGLPRAIEAFYASPFFEHPIPHYEETPEKGPGDGRLLSISVRYVDREAERPAPAVMRAPAKAPSKTAARSRAR